MKSTTSTLYRLSAILYILFCLVLTIPIGILVAIWMAFSDLKTLISHKECPLEISDDVPEVQTDLIYENCAHCSALLVTSVAKRLEKTLQLSVGTENEMVAWCNVDCMARYYQNHPKLVPYGDPCVACGDRREENVADKYVICLPCGAYKREQP